MTSNPAAKEKVQEIGCNAPKIDAFSKVTGEEVFAADLYPSNFLWVGVKRSEFAHARILEIHTSAAAKLSGVVAVLTHRDIKGSNRLGIFEKDQPVLADRLVRHLGEAVALVLAETQEALQAGLAAVAVEYEPLAAVFSVDDAILPGFPVLHPTRPEGNVLLQSTICRGDARAVLAECAFHTSVTVTTGWQEHAFLETQNGVAWLRADGALSMTVSTQTPFRDRLELAEAMGISPAKIHIAAPCLGGAFGGKDGITIQGFLALAAMHAGGRPVKILYSREESSLAGVKRHPLQATYTLGCDEEGMLQAMECRLRFDTGAYASLGGEVFALAMEHAGGPYSIPAVHIEGAVVYTNNPVAGAFRGFGVPQVAAAMEQAIDALAQTGKFDPLEMRIKNAVQRGGMTPTGVVLSQTTGLNECLKRMKEHPFWQQRQAWQESAPAFKRRGTGVAAACHGVGVGPAVADYANAKLELLSDGRIRVFAGVSDMGQGNASTYVQFVSHLLNQKYADMELILPDTEKTLPSASSSASRTTFTYGNALIGAAALLKERIMTRAALMISFQLLQNVRNEELTLLPGKVSHAPSGRGVPLAAVAALMDGAERVATYSFTSPVNNQTLTQGQNLRIHGFPHRVFSYGVQLVRLEADTCTGEITIYDALSCIDAGTVLNPQLYEQQVHGGVAQGLGYALFEEFVLLDGQIATKDFGTYILPTAADLPEMEVVPVTPYEPDGPFGMKGVGEISIDAVFPATANAIASAVGCRLCEGTLTAEKVLAGFRQTGQEAAP